MLHPEAVPSVTYDIPNAYDDVHGLLSTYWIDYPILPIVFLIRWRIVAYLNQRSIFSTPNEMMHRSLFRALSFQALLSFLNLFGAFLSYPDSIFQLRIDGLFFEYALHIFGGFIPVLFQFTALYFVVRYWKYTKSLMDRRKAVSTFTVSVSAKFSVVPSRHQSAGSYQFFCLIY